MNGLSKSGTADEGLSSSYPKSSGAFLSSLFRSKSRDGDSDAAHKENDVKPGVSAPSALPSNGSAGSGKQLPIKHVKATDKAESSSSSSSTWLLNRKSSDKKKDRPERLKNALFGHSHQASPLSREVKGAVKVGLTQLHDRRLGWLQKTDNCFHRNSQDEWPMYSGKAEDYEMGEAIGRSLQVI